MAESGDPLVSVIIPVYNDPERLRLCLCALDEQMYPRDRYEVIVVNNGSDEPLDAVVAEFSCAMLATEAKPGSYAARNKGIQLAQGEIIAFTDADCIPAPDWIERGVRRLVQEPLAGLVAGRINVFPRDPNHPTCAEVYDSYYAFPQDHHIAQYQFGATANVFTRRAVIDDVGPFDDRLKSTGDTEWGQRVAACGYEVIYADDAVVAHPARRSLAEVCTKTRRVAGGVHDRGKNRPFPIGRTVGNLAWDVVCLLTTPLTVLRDSKVRSLDAKVKVLYVALALRLALMYERIRLQLGGQSLRR